jgi:hypothetical protein
MKNYFGSATYILIFINGVHLKTCVYVIGCFQYGLYTVTVDLCVINEYKVRLLSTSWSNTMHIHSQVIFRHVSVAATAIIRVDTRTYIHKREHTHTHTHTHRYTQMDYRSGGLPTFIWQLEYLV